MTMNTKALSEAQAPGAKPLLLLPPLQKVVEDQEAMMLHQWGFYRNHSTPGLDTKETSGQVFSKNCRLKLSTDNPIRVSHEHAPHSNVGMSL